MTMVLLVPLELRYEQQPLLIPQLRLMLQQVTLQLLLSALL